MSAVRPDLGAGRRWRRVLVYGLGLSGAAAARLATSRGVAVLGVDRRAPRDLDLELPAGSRFEGWSEEEAVGRQLPSDVEAVVLSPGVPPDRPLLVEARRRGLPVIAEIELAFPLLDGPVVAVTGSNGKSTTTALAGAMLAAAGRRVEVCGNIGTALSAVVDGPPDRVFVVEVSSFQLEAVDSFRPRAAAWLNLSADHLDRYAGLDEYAAAKERIFARQGEGDVAVLNADDARVAAITVRSRRRLFSRRGAVADGCFVAGGTVVERTAGGADGEPLFRLDALPLAGAHNLENAMAAALLARALDAPPAAIADALAGFAGLPHRMQRLEVGGPLLWYDDSKATNVAAAAKSLEGLPDGRVHLILGGRAKGDDPAELAELVGVKAKAMYVIGESADLFAAALGGVAPCHRVGTLERAVAEATRRGEPGDVVLLAPACASFDQFDSYAHRGREFARLAAASVAAPVPGGAG
ncbi:MAG TPA: UDP-N-acetylmuramoyl-L-alanine--D-glutamate ligase [Thermoanaerobaculia bacterium]|nr:UDP-N-acetylmuramoyl-L-alanine--D-glutamate ligase [Thermoanaerobaculia bacterium]